MGEGIRPARPHLRFTEDGHRVREVVSYSRRGSRFSERERDAWDRRAATWVIPDEAVDDPGFDLSGWFGRSAPLVVEIGSGVGESLVALAGARPSYDVLAFEVWRPGVAGALWRLEEGSFCGWPDSVAGVPVTDERYRPAQGPAPQLVMQEHPPVAQPL